LYHIFNDIGVAIVQAPVSNNDLANSISFLTLKFGEFMEAMGENRKKSDESSIQMQKNINVLIESQSRNDESSIQMQKNINVLIESQSRNDENSIQMQKNINVLIESQSRNDESIRKLGDVLTESIKSNKENMEQLQQLLRTQPTSKNIQVTSTNSHHGKTIINLLVSSGRKTALMSETGSSIPSGCIQKAIEMRSSNTHRNEKYLVNLFTPQFTEILRIVDPDLRIVNSEEYKWLQCSADDPNADLKPDLFSCFHPLITYRSPYKNAIEGDRLFGQYRDWNSRSSIHCIWDAKWKIDDEAFGEKCKYLQIAGQGTKDHAGSPLMLKGILFDADSFWAITSAGNEIISVVTSEWSRLGSKEFLINFLRPSDPWMKATLALCETLKVRIEDFSARSVIVNESFAILGSGASGRVFRLEDGQALKVVIGASCDGFEIEFLNMEMLSKNPSTKDFVFPVVENSYKKGVLDGVHYAGYLLSAVGKPFNATSITPAQLEKIAVSLSALHRQGITHGDARIQNVLLYDGDARWIDFHHSKFQFTTEDLILNDISLLLESLGRPCDSTEILRKYSTISGERTPQNLCLIINE